MYLLDSMALIFKTICINLLVKQNYWQKTDSLYWICPILRLLIFAIKIISLVPLACNLSVVFGKVLPFLASPILPLRKPHWSNLDTAAQGLGQWKKQICMLELMGDCVWILRIHAGEIGGGGAVWTKRKCVFSLKLPLAFIKAWQHLIIWIFLA